MYQLTNFDFNQNEKTGVVKVFFEKLFLGYILQKENIFIHLNSKVYIEQKYKKQIFKLEKSIKENEPKKTFFKKQMDDFMNSDNLKQINYLKENELSIIQSVNDAMTLLLPYLEEKKISYKETINSLGLINSSLENVYRDFENLGISDIYDEKLFNFYPMTKIYTEKHFPGTKELLTRNFLKNSMGKDDFSIFDLTINYEFMTDKENDIYLLEQNILNNLHDKETVRALLSFYMGHFVTIKSLFGQYEGKLFYIYDDLVYFFDEDDTDLLFQLYLFSK